MAISPSRVNSFSYGKNDPISHVLTMAHMMLFIDVYGWFKSSGIYIYIYLSIYIYIYLYIYRETVYSIIW